MAALGAGWSAAAAAQSPPQYYYLRADTGGSFSKNAGKDVGVDIGSSPIVGAGVGAKFLPFLRTDPTVSYRPSYSFTAPDTTLVPGTIGKGDVKTLAALRGRILRGPADRRTRLGCGTFLGAPITAPVQRGNIRAHEIQAGIRVGF